MDCGPNRNLMAVLNYLWDLPKDEAIAPSKYYQEMKMTTDERLEFIYQKRKNRQLIPEIGFLVSPDIIVFQNFSTQKFYYAMVSLMNKNEVSKNLKIVSKKTRNFSIIHKGDVLWTKVAPGMSYQIAIKFFADEIRDYGYNIDFVCEDQYFTIPVIALKPRVLIDMADLIQLPQTPVKMVAEKTVCIKNMGTISASCRILPHNIFTVDPEKFLINSGAVGHFKVSLKGDESGHKLYDLTVTVNYEIILVVEVECEFTTLNIRFKKSALVFNDTFMGLERYSTVIVENVSPYIIDFQWKLYESYVVDNVEREKFKKSFIEMREYQSNRFTNLAMMGVIDRETHLEVYNRILQNEIEDLEISPQFLFSNNPHFKIIPLIGQIQPNDCIQFTVIFSPYKSKNYEDCAYLDATGLEGRLPLKIYAKGLGPKINFVLCKLNINNIYVRTNYKYDIEVANTGAITANITYHERPLDFGIKLICSPASQEVKPGHFGVFTLTLITSQKGKFLEKIEYIIEESQENQHFVITGNAVVPLLTLDFDEIHLGAIPLGLITTRELVLNNFTSTPILYWIRLLGDGDQLLPTKIISFSNTNDISENIKDMAIDPSDGQVSEFSGQTCKLSVMPTKLGIRKIVLVINMRDAENILMLPVTYESLIPKIICEPAVVDIKYCFINYFYYEKVTIKNISNCPSNICIIQKENEGGIFADFAPSSLLLPALKEMELRVKIKAKKLGLFELPVCYTIFGYETPLFKIVCNGQGPVIIVEPEHLSFGKVELLQTTTKRIMITNCAPIRANISVSITKPTFSVKEHDFELQSKKTKCLKVNAYANNRGKCGASLILNINQEQQLKSSISCFGVGTPIFCEPPLNTELNCGTWLTHAKVRIPVKLTNKGSKDHKLLMTWDQNPRSIKNGYEDTTKSVFKLIPNYFQLSLNEEAEMEINAFAKKPMVFSRKMYCFSVVGKSSRKSLEFTCLLKAVFIDPSLDISKNMLAFRMNLTPQCQSHLFEASISDQLTITNRAALRIELEVITQSPFYLSENDEKLENLDVILENNESRVIRVAFCPPADSEKNQMWETYLMFNYKKHPKIDCILVTGVIS